MKKEVINTIIETIEEFNNSLEKNNQLPTDPDGSIYGEGSNLDSLGLVSFIIGVEQNIEDKFDQSISLADEKAMSQKSNPYNNINSLADYIIKLLPKN
tara:strand:- start:656 stop:949 length:294 start_codon:yes stop_codon:yes gene_type:complete